MGENNSKRSNWQRTNLKNIQATPAAQSQTNKQPNQKMGQRTKQTFLQRRHQFSSVQSLSHVRLSATPWIAAHQASLSITNSWSLLRLMFIESVMPSRYLIFCHPLLFCPQSLPASESFPMSQLFAWGSQSIGVSALASVLPMNTQDWSPLAWTGWISLQSKGL